MNCINYMNYINYQSYSIHMVDNNEIIGMSHGVKKTLQFAILTLNSIDENKYKIKLLCELNNFNDMVNVYNYFSVREDSNDYTYIMFNGCLNDILRNSTVTSCIKDIIRNNQDNRYSYSYKNLYDTSTLCHDI